MKKKLSALGVILATLTLGGCIDLETKAISSQNAAGIEGKTVVAVSRKKPDFVAFDGTKAAINGIRGFGALVYAGNTIVKENDIADPANAIANRLAAALGETRAIEVAAAPLYVGKHMDSVAQLINQATGKAQMVLDVQTVDWAIVFFPPDRNTYRVRYMAKARLIDLASTSVLAEGGCAHIPEKAPDDPSREELLANGAERLKHELDLAADECVEKLKREMLAI